MNEINCYFAIDHDFIDFDKIDKLFFLLLRRKVSLVRKENVFEIEKISIDEWNTLRLSFDAIKGDLHLEHILLVSIPCFNESLYNIIYKCDFDGVYSINELLIKEIQSQCLDVEVLTNIVKDVPQDILKTVKTYVELNHSVDATRKVMFAHRNTINYRITRFVEITNIDIRETSNSMFIYIVLMFVEI